MRLAVASVDNNYTTVGLTAEKCSLHNEHYSIRPTFGRKTIVAYTTSRALAKSRGKANVENLIMVVWQQQM